MFGIKGHCLGLISSASISVQQTPFLHYNGGCIILRTDYLVCTPNAKICITLYTLHTRVRVLCVIGISEKIGDRRNEAEPKSHISCLELMAVIFGLKAFCSRKSNSPYLNYLNNRTIVNCLNSMRGTHFIECNSAAKDI